jgi:serine/threonine protein kinase/tetratricopeptide (TPR) repeat protein
MTGTNEPTEQPAAPPFLSAHQIVARFRQAWEQGGRPKVEDFLPADLEQRRAVLADLVRADQEYCRKAGEADPLATYLERYPELADDASILDALLALENTVWQSPEAANELDPTRPQPDQAHPSELPTNPSSGKKQVFDELMRPAPDDLTHTKTASPFAAGNMDQTTPNPPGAAERPRVAGYEILAELGRGGMGVVYKARHLQLKRLVALKMILAGPHAGPSHLARFRSEAEAAARLQHPNVVQIYEVGDQDGRPYFSLEYVDGGTLAQRLTQAALPARQAAELVETLARAVQYAHQRGIVHRDLKPANVLLGVEGGAWSVEGEGQKAIAQDFPPSARHPPPATLHPKITDFGLAKQLGSDSSQTLSGQIMGTPSYMAPEQARGQAKAIGPATDIYALGAVLYECLTGRPPFRGASVLDTLEQVQTQEPVPPSRLQPKVPRDLETICLKCLQKDTAKRYATALELADDLERFQNGVSIRARPTPAVERLVLWARRRPSVAALLAVSVLAVLGLIGGGLWYNAQLREAVQRAEANEAEARDEREAARRQQARAEANFLKAQEAVNQLLTRVGERRLAGVPGMDEVRRELLQDALRFYLGFLKEKDNPDPAVRHETGLAHARVAYIQQSLGQPKPAEENILLALSLLEKLTAAAPEVWEYQKSLAFTEQNLAELYFEIKRMDQAEAYYQKAKSHWSARVADHPDDVSTLMLLAQVYNNLGNLYAATGRLNEAEQALKEALTLRERLADDPSQSETYRQNVAQSHNNLGVLYQGMDRTREAEAHYMKALAWFTELANHYPENITYQAELAACHNNLGCLLGAPGQFQQAEAEHKQALAIRGRLAQEHPRLPHWQEALATSYYNLANLYRSAGRLADAEREHQKGLALRKQLAQEYRETPTYQEALAQSYLHLGPLYELTKRPEQAESAYRNAVALLEPVARAHPETVAIADLLGKSAWHLALLLSNRSKPKEAIECCTKSIAVLEPVLKKDSRHGQARITLRAAYALRGMLFEKTGRSFEAARDLVRWYALDEPAEKNPPKSAAPKGNTKLDPVKK